MHYLGLDFILLSILLLSVIFTLVFIYRNKIFKNAYMEQDNDIFIKEVKEYLHNTYPEFDFDLSVLSIKRNDANPHTIKFEMIDNIIKQYVQKEIQINIIQGISIDSLWSEYTFLSKPIGNKLPNDWIKRKKEVLKRDNNLCLRCKKKISIKTSTLLTKISIENKGQYYLENLYALCYDCNNIKNNKFNKLLIEDELYKIIIKQSK